MLHAKTSLCGFWGTCELCLSSRTVFPLHSRTQFSYDFVLNICSANEVNETMNLSTELGKHYQSENLPHLFLLRPEVNFQVFANQFIANPRNEQRHPNLVRSFSFVSCASFIWHWACLLTGVCLCVWCLFNYVCLMCVWWHCVFDVCLMCVWCVFDVCLMTLCVWCMFNVCLMCV